MILYHGSNNSDIETLIPMQADGDRPFVYLSENEVVASFYIINCVERPFYWFPYGFTKDRVPQYHELYPNALLLACEGKTGCVYTVDTQQENLLPFKNIPGAWLATVPLPTVRRKDITDPYSWFLDQEKDGCLYISRYEQKNERELLGWDNLIVEYMSEKRMIEMPDCSYAKFIREKFPHVWNRYEQLRGKPPVTS